MANERDLFCAITTRIAAVSWSKGSVRISREGANGVCGAYPSTSQMYPLSYTGTREGTA